MSENKFPTIRDFRDALAALVERGLGDLPAQIVVVPDSTIQAVARALDGPQDKPALMIDLSQTDGRLPVSLISTDRMKTTPLGTH